MVPLYRQRCQWRFIINNISNVTYLLPAYIMVSAESNKYPFEAAAGAPIAPARRRLFGASAGASKRYLLIPHSPLMGSDNSNRQH